MPACESKFVSRRSREATVAKSVRLDSAVWIAHYKEKGLPSLVPKPPPCLFFSLSSVCLQYDTRKWKNNEKQARPELIHHE